MPIVTDAITIYRGTSPAITFTRNENGSQAGATIRFSVRKKETSADPLLLDVGATIVQVGSSSTPAIVTVSLSKAQTLLLTVGTYVFSLERVDAGLENLWNKGPLIVEYDVRNSK